MTVFFTMFPPFSCSLRLAIQPAVEPTQRPGGKQRGAKRPVCFADLLANNTDDLTGLHLTNCGEGCGH
jgi:hypothetical protein